MLGSKWKCRRHINGTETPFTGTSIVMTLEVKEDVIPESKTFLVYALLM